MESAGGARCSFEPQAAFEKDGMCFFGVDQRPFSIHGVFKENGRYRRIPEAVAKTVSEGVYGLHANTAGGRIRFKTNSGRIAIIAKMLQIGKMPHFAFSGSCGFDLYSKENGSVFYRGTFIPPVDIADGFESVLQLPDDSLRDITINFPLYSGVSDLLVGIEKGAALEKAESYKITKPLVFYGSSITQGGCASRPGNSYQSILSRVFDCDYINLGFSGCAKAEDEIADYIKSLEMSVFVFDYDHNAPNTEHLEKTHEKMFLKVREHNPKLPIILMSRPKYYLNSEEEKRLEIIKNTYHNALARGDGNVYLIDGRALMEIAKDDGTVDGCHPNDLGFFSMAGALKKVLEKVLPR